MDEVILWRTAMERVSALAESWDERTAERTVPACPAWTARELLSHMVGLGADVLGGDEPDDHNADWTQRQVEERADLTTAELVAEWRGLADDLEQWMRAHGTRPLNDVVIHEQDLRSAVGAPGARDTEELAVVRDRMVGRFADRLGGLAPIALVGDTWRWCSAGEVDDAAVVVRASDFDLARALTSRRTPQQLASWTEGGDLAPYLPAFGALGPLPEDALPE